MVARVCGDEKRASMQRLSKSPFVFSGFHSIVSRMNLLPFGELPVHTPRQFVPQKIDLGNWSEVAPLFDALEKEFTSGKTAADLESALLHWSELSAALDE